jgi:hypothetical protein
MEHVMVVILTSYGPVHQPALYAQKIITGQYVINPSFEFYAFTGKFK